MDVALQEIEQITEHPFLDKYRSSFVELCDKMALDKPPYVLCVARKGPRLFDLFEEEVNQRKGVPLIISDRAIPFLNFRDACGKHMPVVDDIVIYGSTMKTIVDKLRDMARVEPQSYCLVYDIDKAKFKDVEAQEYLTSDMVGAFCHEIADAFSLLGIPYDIDHPVFLLHNTSSQQLEAIKKIEGIAEITTSLQKTFGILNLVSYPEPLISLDELFSHENCDFYLSLHKTRLYYDSRKNRLCIVPVVLFGLRVKDINNPIFSSAYLEKIIRKALEIFEANDLPMDEIEESIYRLVFYIVEYIYGLLFLRYIQNAVNKNLLCEYSIRQKDVRLIFGESFGTFLVETLEENKNSIISTLQTPGRRIQYSSDRVQHREEAVEHEELFKELFERADYEDFGKHLLWNNAANSVWSICMLMRRKDLLSRDPEKIIPNRLRFGFSFDDLFKITQNKCPNVTKRKLSVILDCLIDKGAVVPIFLKYPTNYYVRAFRFGESVEKKRMYFVKSALEFLFRKANLRNISQFDFEKLFSFLHDIYTGSILPQEERITFKSLEITKGYDEFGARVFSKTFSRMEENEPGGEVHPFGSAPLFRETLENKLLKKVTDYGFELGDKETIDILYPSQNDPLKSIQADLLLYVSFFADVCFGKDRPHPRKDEVALALTTCNDPTNFLATYPVGIYAWFDHEKVRFGKILNNVKLLVSDNAEDQNKWAEIGDLLHNLAERLRQCDTKKDVWKKAPLIMEEIDHWSKRESYREGLWLKIKELLINRSYFKDKEQTIYDHLFWLYRICRLNINVLRSALTHYGLTLPSKRAGNFADYIKAYNRFVMNYERFCSLKKIPETLGGSNGKFQELSILLDVLDFNSDKLYDKFSEIKQYEREEIKKVRYFDCDMALVRYDLKGYSDLTPFERERIASIIDKHMKPYLDSLGESKYYYSVFNDEHTWPISNAEKALEASQKFVEVLLSESTHGRVVIHYTSPNDRIQIYEGETGEALGGDPFIITGRLIELAENLQKSRKEIANVILITEDAYLNVPRDLKEKLNIMGPYETPVQGKSIRRIKYYEINETKLKETFCPIG
jgi:hypothetical protein